MKLIKKNGNSGSISLIWNDDSSEFMGLVGTIEDLTAVGAMEGSSQYSRDTWCCLPDTNRIERWAGFGETQQQAIENTVFGVKIGGKRDDKFRRFIQGTQ